MYPDDMAPSRKTFGMFCEPSGSLDSNISIERLETDEVAPIFLGRNVTDCYCPKLTWTICSSLLYLYLSPFNAPFSLGAFVTSCVTYAPCGLYALLKFND